LNDEIDISHQVKCEYTNKTTLYSIWEIQKSETFQGYDCKYTDFFRIKNISTGLFLAVDKSNNGKISLSKSGHEDECFFKFIPRENVSQEQPINYKNVLKIQSMDKKFLKIDEGN
jgi:hypothetical protein